MSCLSAAARMPIFDCSLIGRSWSAGGISSSVTDRLIHWAERVHIRPLRKIALKKAEKWMLERLEMSRRPGGDLSGDVELDYCAALPGIFAGRSAGDSGDG